MTKRALNLFLIVIMALSSFISVAKASNDRPPFTEIGYQTDGNYYYTFYVDLSKDGPNAIAYIQVQKNSTGEVLKLDNFSGKVMLLNPVKFSIKDKATVSFYDGNKLISKDLKGALEGSVKP
ncbi:hypothetical protein L3C95_19520 [Chitinophaga filiformis]|uniref:hypothetical protein n=1 Tax=Chitinophaga filiformis TaxID=104663 RepID=UPI001F382968|nr:hypothetical protein [Chitinophaga filiformis]MCF6405101.1 hypothetical protein [Chitinophaga filiformis]